MNQFNVSGTRILNKALISLAILAITLPVIGCSSNDNVKSFGKMEQKNHNLQGRLLPSPIEKNNVALPVFMISLFLTNKKYIIKNNKKPSSPAS